MGEVEKEKCLFLVLMILNMLIMSKIYLKLCGSVAKMKV